MAISATSYGYTSEVSVETTDTRIIYTVTNTYQGALPQYTDLIVTNDWLSNDKNAQYDSVEVQLLRDGEDYGDTFVLSEENNWQHRWFDLEGDREWSARLVGPLPDGYASTIRSNAYMTMTSEGRHGYTVCSIANIHENARPPGVSGGPSRFSTNYSVIRKVWFDDDDAKRPDSITIDQTNNRWVELDWWTVELESFSETVTVTKEGGWRNIFEGIFASYNRIMEQAPDEYVSKVVYNDTVRVIANIAVSGETEEPAGWLVLPDTGGAGTRNMTLIGCTLLFASGLVRQGNRSRERC